MVYCKHRGGKLKKICTREISIYSNWVFMTVEVRLRSLIHRNRQIEAFYYYFISFVKHQVKCAYVPTPIFECSPSRSSAHSRANISQSSSSFRLWSSLVIVSLFPLLRRLCEQTSKNFAFFARRPLLYRGTKILQKRNREHTSYAVYAVRICIALFLPPPPGPLLLWQKFWKPEKFSFCSFGPVSQAEEEEVAALKIFLPMQISVSTYTAQIANEKKRGKRERRGEKKDCGDVSGGGGWLVGPMSELTPLKPHHSSKAGLWVVVWRTKQLPKQFMFCGTTIKVLFFTITGDFASRLDGSTVHSTFIVCCLHVCHLVFPWSLRRMYYTVWPKGPFPAYLSPPPSISPPCSISHRPRKGGRRKGLSGSCKIHHPPLVGIWGREGAPRS